MQTTGRVGSTHDDPVVMLMQCDVELRFLFVDAAYARRFGCKPDDVVGRRLPDVVGAEPFALVRPYVQRAVAGETVDFEAELPFEDLGRRLMHVRYVPYRTDDGRVAGFVGVLADVTAQRRTEQRTTALAEAAQARLLFLADAGTKLASSLDYATTLDSVARLAVRHLGDYCVVDVFESDASVRRVAAVHADPTKAPLMDRLRAMPPAMQSGERVARALRTGEPDVVNDIDPTRLAESISDADRRQLMTDLAPCAYMVLPLGAHGDVVGTLTLVSTDRGRRYGEDDATLGRDLARRAALAIENARLHRAEQRARAEAEAANRAKDEFLSMVSHELRTPLSSMHGWLRVLRTGNRDQVPRALETLERNINAQRKLIDDLLDVSRIVMGRLRIDRQPVDLAPVVRTAVDAMRVEADTKRVRLDVAIAPLPAPVTGDVERLGQVVLNLLSNAVKFTPAGGAVSVRLDAVGTGARLVVQDTGKGIDSDFLPHVFERFRQAESVVGRESGGLGLGLAISRHLVELHGGTIVAKSDGADRGAAFSVTLPLAKNNV